LVKKEDHKFTVSKEDIKKGLRNLGIDFGFFLGVHSSLGSFGNVKGGANTVIDAILEIVGKEGTIVMPTYSTNRIEYKLTPEEKAIGLLWKFKILPYNSIQTPCWTGIIPETFRKKEGVLRSNHPVFSIASRGSKARIIIDEGNISTLGGWKKLLELGGYILLIGVDLDSCTAMHIAEEKVSLPKHIIDKITPPKWIIEKYPESEWETDFGPYPDFLKFEAPCMQRKIMKSEKVGNATLKLVNLKNLIDLYVEYLKTDPDLFYS
jgi:aminoglycoside 3-N-acetyltransferase